MAPGKGRQLDLAVLEADVCSKSQPARFEALSLHLLLHPCLVVYRWLVTLCLTFPAASPACERLPAQCQSVLPDVTLLRRSHMPNAQFPRPVSWIQLSLQRLNLINLSLSLSTFSCAIVQAYETFIHPLIASFRFTQ